MERAPERPRRGRLRALIRSLLVVGFTSSFVVGVSFLRGVILARILGPHQYGLAVLLISVTAALDLFADAGIDRFIVQNRFGTRGDVMSTSHAYRVGGSLIAALAVVALSFPLSLLFKAPELLVPIALTGGVVALRGFVNLSYKLQQREQKFAAETRINMWMYGADLIVTTVVALVTESFIAILVGFYVNAVVHLLLSHALATQKYSFMPRQRLIGLVGRFSLPIYLNAGLLFAAVQGDRLVVAASYSKQDLAFYAVACAIGQGVVGVVTKVTMSTLLPVLSGHGQPHATRRRHANMTGAAIIAGSVLFMLALVLVGPWLVATVYGPEFSGLRSLIFASAVVQMIQLEQGWMTTLLMANNRTKSFPAITLMRGAALPVAILFVGLGMPILAIPLAFALGAMLSLAVSYYVARSLDLIDSRLILASIGRIGLAVLAILWLIEREGQSRWFGALFS